MKVSEFQQGVSIESVLGTVHVYEYHPALEGEQGAPYLVIEADTEFGTDRIKVYVDDRQVHRGADVEDVEASLGG